MQLPVWDGKLRSEPGTYKERKQDIKATQLAYDIQDNRYALLLFLATKDDARNVLWGQGAESLISPEMIMNRLRKEFDKLGFEKSELAYQNFERCGRTPGQPMSAYLQDMDRTYTTCRIQNPDTSRAGRVGAHGMVAGRGEQNCSPIELCA